MVVLAPHGVSGTYGQLYMAHEPTLYALHITVLQRLTFYRDTKLWVHDHISTPTVVIKMERLNVIKIASIPLSHTTYQYHSILIKINIKYRYDTGKYSSLKCTGELQSHALMTCLVWHNRSHAELGKWGLFARD